MKVVAKVVEQSCFCMAPWSTGALRMHCTVVEEIAGAGHSAHVEKPESIVLQLERLKEYV